MRRNGLQISIITYLAQSKNRLMYWKEFRCHTFWRQKEKLICMRTESKLTKRKKEKHAVAYKMPSFK